MQWIDKELYEKVTNMKNEQAGQFMEENADVFIKPETAFAEYMRTLIRNKNLTFQNIFLQADISEKYGYKLISQEKHTRQRDIILRLCYAAEFTLEETQEALRLYGMPELFVRIQRDALIMIAFTDRPGSVIELNEYLQRNKVSPLRSCGVTD